MATNPRAADDFEKIRERMEEIAKARQIDPPETTAEGEPIGTCFACARDKAACNGACYGC